MLYTLVAFVVALGLIITFHEYGHYWAARRCGVKVLRFSVGFGRVLARRTDRRGTEWALSAIPLGGYVKMLDEPDPAQQGRDQDQAFNRQGVGRRFFIVAAGPLANFLLAALLYAALAAVGTQEPAPVLAAPPAGTAAAQAGLEQGERITAIDGSPIRSWNEARWKLLDALTSGGSVELATESATGVARMRMLALPAAPPDPQTDPMAGAGLALAPARPRIEQVVPDGAGALAGLMPGDIILAAGGLSDPSPRTLVEEIQASAGQPIAVTVSRGGTSLNLRVTPRAEDDGQGARVGRIGVMLGADFPMATVRYGLLESAARGVSRTVDTAWFSLKMMGRMVTGSVSVRNISGPVTIADYAGQTARIGLAAYISFLALISVSIGVLNLLPIPMLDGGHLMYYMLEIIRGKPVPEQWLQAGQRVGLGLLAALMGLAFFNDFTRLFS